MPPRVKLVFLSLMVVLFLIPAIALYSELHRRSDIWWTPRTLMVPLAAGTDRVEVYAGEKRLEALLDGGQVQLVTSSGPIVLAKSDIRLRFNNWDRVRAERINLLLFYAAACGAIALLFLMLLTGRLAYRGERERVAT